MIHLSSDIVTIIGQIRPSADQPSTSRTSNRSTRSRPEPDKQCRQQWKDNASHIQAISRTWALLLNGLDQLIARRANVVAIDKVVSTIIECFPPIIATILEHTELSICTSLSDTSGRLHASSTADTSSSASTTDLEITTTHYHLCRLYVLMMATLNIEDSKHKVIMDSAMSFLLKLAGVILEAFVLNKENSPSLHRSKLRLRDNLDKEPGPLVVSLASMEAIAPYLVWLLERALVFFRKLRRTMAGLDPVSTEIDHPLSASPRKRYAVSDLDKERLKNTLMHVMFPDDHIRFEDRLREPCISDSLVDIPIPIVASADVRNWFKQEVWRILAWDIVVESV